MGYTIIPGSTTDLGIGAGLILTGLGILFHGIRLFSCDKITGTNDSSIIFPCGLKIHTSDGDIGGYSQRKVSSEGCPIHGKKCKKQ